MKFLNFFFINTYYDLLWIIMIYYEILWIIMNYYEILCIIMKYYELLWKYLEINLIYFSINF